VGGLDDLKKTLNLLTWDMANGLPPEGAEGRVYQMATLTHAHHKLLTAPDLGQLLTVLQAPDRFAQLSATQQKIVRAVQKERATAEKVPVELLESIIVAKAMAYQSWMKARQLNSFEVFAPALEQLVQLNRQLAEAVGYEGSPYNVLLAQNEAGMTTDKLDALFGRLKSELIPLSRQIQAQNQQPDQAEKLRQPFNISKLKAFGLKLMQDMGVRLSANRLAYSPSAYFLPLGKGNGALSLSVTPNDLFSSISSFTHEGGHGLYYQEINPEYARTPLFGPTSHGIDESQARLLENFVGRSKPFWQHYLPLLKKVFPKQLKDITPSQFHQAINVSKPTLYRGDADEVTYNLHVMLRYELEKDLLEGRLSVRDIPTKWREKMRDYVGIEPQNDNEGPLQDIHWAANYFGYFPTYTTGTLYAAQFYNKLKQELPAVEEQMAQGNLAPLTRWLTEKIHRTGAAETTEEILTRVTGEPLNPDHLINYLKAKYTQLYNLTPPAGSA
jgi:carboxypeptidase Taq